MYIQVYNKNNAKQTMLVQELTDLLFEEGWRVLAFLGNNVTAEQIHAKQEHHRQANIRQYGF